MMMTHLLFHTNDLTLLGQMSFATEHHDIWYQSTHVTVVINATTNCELERPKSHYALRPNRPPPPPHPNSVTACLINIYYKHRVRLRLFIISRSQEVHEGDNLLDRTKRTWHNKKEKKINELSFESTQGFPRIERVFPRTWVAAYISSASRLEWQSNIGEAFTYEVIYN